MRQAASGALVRLLRGAHGEELLCRCAPLGGFGFQCEARPPLPEAFCVRRLLVPMGKEEPAAYYGLFGGGIPAQPLADSALTVQTRQFIDTMVCTQLNGGPGGGTTARSVLTSPQHPANRSPR